MLDAPPSPVLLYFLSTNSNQWPYLMAFSSRLHISHAVHGTTQAINHFSASFPKLPLVCLPQESGCERNATRQIKSISTSSVGSDHHYRRCLGHADARIAPPFSMSSRLRELRAIIRQQELAIILQHHAHKGGPSLKTTLNAYPRSALFLFLVLKAYKLADNSYTDCLILAAPPIPPRC